jgi:hypothetical protein
MKVYLCITAREKNTLKSYAQKHGGGSGGGGGGVKL